MKTPIRGHLWLVLRKFGAVAWLLVSHRQSGNSPTMLSLSDDPFRVFVIAKRNEFGMSQMVSTSPLQKSYLSHGLGRQPQCRMPDYAELGCCECCHYCVQRHFVRHNPREYASNGIVPHLVASVNASRLFSLLTRLHCRGRDDHH
jgi:hypothetical protein